MPQAVQSLYAVPVISMITIVAITSSLNSEQKNHLIALCTKTEIIQSNSFH